MMCQLGKAEARSLEFSPYNDLGEKFFYEGWRKEERKQAAGGLQTSPKGLAKEVLLKRTFHM